jgi:hypothetical protein
VGQPCGLTASFFLDFLVLFDQAKRTRIGLGQSLCSFRFAAKPVNLIIRKQVYQDIINFMHSEIEDLFLSPDFILFLFEWLKTN